MEQFKALWAGRSRRREYWASLVALVIAYLMLASVAGPVIASTASFPFWLLIGTRRLHDVGATGWLSLIPFGLGFVTSFAVSFAAGIGSPLPVDAREANLLASLVSMIFMIGLGIWPPRARPAVRPEPEAAA
ncbi:DUF805 domain-containing protein [Brevundimonas goettingensis]|uniref:DUF805 domain-containing protein n=1 Tax=Brevundimonas goettingensis TaxID=2774190 RepID=A0A975GXW2_9CAUL|nr:DUF805 domain-containing protein [Brevundimonas goettingensis]QTC90970.1 DUF805 domain-containing protein [Brevundimonas goettingensis]